MKKLLIAAAMLSFGLGASAQNLQMKENLLEGDNSTFNTGWGSWGDQGSKANKSLEVTGGPDGSQCAKLSNSDASNDYDAQLKYGYEATNGTTYVFRLKARKVSGGGTIKVILQHNSGNYEQQAFFETEVTDSWATYEGKITASRGDYDVLMINYGKCGEVLIDDIEFGEEAVPDANPAGNLIPENAWGLENNDLNGWVSYAENFSTEIATPGYVSNYCLKATNGQARENWQAQSVYILSEPLIVGGVYTITMRAKADENATIGVVMSQAEKPWGSEIGTNMDLTTEWKQFSYDETITKENINRLTLNLGVTATSYYFDNISIVCKSAPVHATGVTLDKTAAEVGVGSNITLVATVAPANASFKDVTWESDATGIATVDENGVVTGVAEGTANITVTTVDGSFKATCAVTVEKLSWTAVANGSAIKYAWDEETKTIYLRGEGEMPSFNGTHGFAYKDNLDNVENIVIGEGITTIGDHAFDACNVSNVTFPSTLTAIGDQALKQTSNLSSCDLSNTKIINFNCDAFKWAGGKTVQFPPTLQSITGSGDFSNSTYEFHSIPAFTNALNNPASVSIILNDAEHPFIAEATTNMPEMNKVQIQYKRNVTAPYSTICLPFEVSELGGVKVYEMTVNASPSIVTLTEAASIEAGKPYVVATADIDFTVNNPQSIVVTPSTSSAGTMELVGVMQKRTLTESDNAYGLSGGKLYYNTGNMTMNPMRAYFQTTSSAPAREMSFSFGEATAISNVAAESDIVAVYGANGARQARLTKGVNLVKTANGNIMKVIVK